MLAIGATAPDFTATNPDGSTFTLSAHHGRPVVLFFYPKADSPGCTREARGFSEHYAEFTRAGFAVVGVSVDTAEAQERFREHCSLPYPLAADPDRAIARKYGVLGWLGLAKRVTFFLGADGRIEEIVEGALPGPHVRRAIERARAPGPAPGSSNLSRPPDAPGEDI